MATEPAQEKDTQQADARQTDARQTEAQKKKETSDVKPDPETLNTTDPQEHMEGPISSLVHKAEKGLDAGPKDEKKS